MEGQTTIEMETKTQVKQLDNVDDEGIDCSDIPELTKEKLLHGKIRFPNLPPKEAAEAVARLRQFAQEYDW